MSMCLFPPWGQFLCSHFCKSTVTHLCGVYEPVTSTHFRWLVVHRPHSKLQELHLWCRFCWRTLYIEMHVVRDDGSRASSLNIELDHTPFCKLGQLLEDAPTIWSIYHMVRLSILSYPVLTTSLDVPPSCKRLDSLSISRYVSSPFCEVSNLHPPGNTEAFRTSSSHW
jgi:hypothetical protein